MDSNRNKASINVINLKTRKNLIEPTLEDAVMFLQERPRMILTEKNPYQADRLMMMLDNEKLAALEEEFNEHPNGIELPNFIWLMKCAISHPQDEKYDLVNGLIKLFQDIDINGDGHMEWAEFTQYIIDAVIGEKDARFFDARSEMAREMTELEVLDRAYSRKSKRYVALSVFDNSTHSNLIKKVQYASNNDNLVCLEQNSNKLKFYSSDCVEKPFKIQPSSEDQSIFVIDFHLAEPLNIIAAVTSDRQFFFWENNMTSRVIKNFKQDVLQTGIYYMPVHQMWLTAGADYNIRAWDINFTEKDTPGQEIFCLYAHLKQITELVELYSPRLIASSSLDGKIKLWDLAERSLMTELKSPQSNSRGIRGLSYNYEYGSNLLSYGFDMHINVWCPEVSITRAFIGKLEGHSSLIVMCKFIIASPNCISVDDRTNIRIWDIRTMSTVQVISSEQTQAVTGLCIISRNDKFVVTGKRLNYYKNGAISTNTKKEQRGMIDDVYPISVEFNLYYNCFVVLTKMDVRLYDAMSGKMKKVFNDVYDDKMQLDLSNFVFGGRQRKFFLSDNAGLIRQYNMKNGEFLKKVNTHNEIEMSEFANKLANIKKRDSLDISALMFLHEEKLLISASQDSTVRIYDESDPEESVLLKVLCGGHNNAEILSMAYSTHFTMLATASSNGLVAIWDFETGKMDGVLVNQQSEIVAMDFAEPFPVIVVAQSNGAISIWNIKQTIQYPRFRCIFRIINTTFINNIQKAVSLTSLVIFSDHAVGVQKQILLPEYSPEFNTPLIVQDHSKGKKAPVFNQQEEIELFQKDWDRYNLEISQKKRRLLIYVSDSLGLIHLLNLGDFLHRKEIYESEKMKKGHSYQLKRKDLIDASKTVEAFMLQEERAQGVHAPLTVHSYGSVLVKQWIAHSATITKMNKIKEPLSFVSNSLDKHFKIWAISGQMYADVNLSQFDDNFWKLPYDWVGQKLKDVELVFDALKLIEKENLTERDKERIKVRFLMNKFFNEAQTEEMQKQLQDQQAKLQGISQIDVHLHTKEKKQRNQQTQNEKSTINFANKQVTEELRVLKLRIQEDRDNKKKIEVPTNMQQKLIEIQQGAGLIERPRTQQGEMVQKLIQKFMQVEGTSEYNPTQTAPGVERTKPSLFTQDKNEDIEKVKNKKKLNRVQSYSQKKKMDVSQLPNLAQIRSNSQLHTIKISSATVMRNNAYISNMVNSLPRPATEQSRNKFVSDMKYQKGEGVRALKVATYTNSLKFMAQSPQIRCEDNQILQMKCKFYKEMNEQQKSEYGSENEDEETHMKSKPKIIASHNFLNNPTKNKHKVLKTKNKIFVV